MSHRWGTALAVLAMMCPAQARADENEEIARRSLKEGMAFFQSGDLRPARAAFQRAHELAPTRANPFRWLGLTEARLGDCAAAVPHLEAFLERIPADDSRTIEVVIPRDTCRAALGLPPAPPPSARPSATPPPTAPATPTATSPPTTQPPATPAHPRDEDETELGPSTPPPTPVVVLPPTQPAPARARRGRGGAAAAIIVVTGAVLLAGGAVGLGVALSSRDPLADRDVRLTVSF